MGAMASGYFKEHNMGMDEPRSADPKQLELERLCYELLLKSKDGEDMFELISERYLIAPLWTPEHPHAPTLALYYEGFKHAFRCLMAMALNHQKRILGQ